MSKRTLGHQGLSIIRATADRLDRLDRKVDEIKTTALPPLPSSAHTPLTAVKRYTRQQRRRARATVEARTVRLVHPEDVRYGAPSYITLRGRTDLEQK